MSIWKNQKSQKYFLGLDIGTNSVGWCVTDENYNVIKKHAYEVDINGKRLGKTGAYLLGSRLFEEASDAKSRRQNRTNRRRLARRKYRIELLRGLFEEEMNKVDPLFFDRLDDSKLYPEDKKENIKNISQVIFTSKEEESNFYKEYPTIYHLRKAMIEKDEKFDLRLVFLVISHMIKYRGNFLRSGKIENVANDPKSLIDSFNAIDDILANIQNEDSIFRFNVDEKKASELLKTFKEEKRSSHLYDKFKELFPDFKNSKDKTRIDELIKLICGRKFKLSPFETKEDSDDDNDKDTKTKDKAIEINDEFENKLLEANLDDDNYNLIIEAKKIYDTRILVNILKDGNSLSTYMVNIYNNHGEQLKELKNLIYKYNKSEYYKFFDKSEEKVKDKNGKETTIKNYYSYINNRADTKLDDLYKRINKILNITDDKGKERENIPEDIKKIKDSMDKQEFLLIQNSSNNGVLPYQLNENELRTILEKQGKYYSFLLNKDKDYLHPNRQEYKIVSLLKFKIPYYVGPISNRGDKDNKHWASKYNIKQKLTPWNFDDIVDRKKSEENFIEKLTNNCTYILGEKTLPKNSLYIQMFNLLNFLNNIKIDNKYIDEETKNYLIDNLYLKYTKIDGKKFKECLKEKYKIDVNVTYASGLKEVEDNAYVNTLSSYVKFIDIYGEDFYKDEDLFNNVEEIIKLVTVLEDKDNLKDKLKSETKFKLDDKQIEKISNFSFKGWSTLCKKLLVDLKYEYIDNVTAEVKNYNVLDFLRHSFKDDNNQDINYNFSFIYNNEDSKSGLITDFKKQVNKLNDEYLNTHSMSENEIIDEAYISPMMKRAVKQTFKIINELLKFLHIEQFDRIFVECTREKQESKSSKSRKDLILEYYNAAKEFKDEVEECKKEIGKFSPDQLRSKKLFLYFMQLGKCVYTG